MHGTVDCAVRIFTSRPFFLKIPASTPTHTTEKAGTKPQSTWVIFSKALDFEWNNRKEDQTTKAAKVEYLNLCIGNLLNHHLQRKSVSAAGELWFHLLPSGGSLISVGNLQDNSFLEITTDNLQPQRQARAGKTATDADCGMAGDVEGERAQ